MARLPFIAHGDTLPICKIGTKKEGQGEARRIVGAEITALLLFDNCTQVKVTVAGLDANQLPSSEAINERNLKMDFLMARFQKLVIEYSGGEYGSIRYKATATGVEFLNLNSVPGTVKKEA